MTVNIANMLTISRLVLAPFFVAAFLTGHHAAAFVIFCVAGFTDLIDGSVARFLKQPSKSGALLDPLADKLLVESCFCVLAVFGVLPLWFFLLALARDIIIVAGIIHLERVKAELPYKPIWSSKLATLFQLACAVLGLLYWWKAELFVSELLKYSILITAAFIVVSGAQYFSLGLSLLKQRKQRIDAR